MSEHYQEPYKRIKLPCGAIAEFDGDFSFRCWNCFAVVGSIGQPQECKDEAKQYELMKALGGKGWTHEDAVIHKY